MSVLFHSHLQEPQFRWSNQFPDRAAIIKMFTLSGTSVTVRNHARQTINAAQFFTEPGPAAEIRSVSSNRQLSATLRFAATRPDAARPTLKTATRIRSQTEATPYGANHGGDTHIIRLIAQGDQTGHAREI
jgi:hypothetical protein